MSHSQRILYIDDNPDHLVIIKMMLTRAGYSCTTANTGETGVELAQSEEFDLMLLDIQMPRTSGFEILKQVEERRGQTGMRVIALTADSSVFSSKSPYELGFDGFLPKPVLAPDLLRVVEQVLAV